MISPGMLSVTHVGPAALGAAFLAGLTFSFNPVAFAAIPVSLAYVIKARERNQAILFGSLFIAGLIVTHAVLGFLAGLGGSWVRAAVGRWWGLWLGPMLILLGFLWTGWVKVPLPAIALRVRRPTSAAGAFLLAVPFSIAVCPVCTPALLVLLGVAATSSSPLFGALLLMAFAIGRSIPIGVGAGAVGWLETMRGLTRFRRVFDVTGGIILIASGLYMLNAYYFWIPQLAE